jgi:hypothetical protein
MFFLNLYFYFIVLSFVASWVTKPDKRHPYLKFFRPFLLVTVIVELIGSYLQFIGKNNHFLYNFFTVVEFCFYMLFISLIITSTTAKKVIRVGSIVYAIISICNILFFQGLLMFHTITYSLGCLVIVAVCIFYFFELFRAPKAVKLSMDPAFWICSGLLFFYCCGFPLYAFINSLGKVEWIMANFNNIIVILNIFLYSLFTIAFLCNRTLKHTSSLS